MRIVLIIKVLDTEDFFRYVHLEGRLLLACTSHAVVVCLIETRETDEDVYDHLSTWDRSNEHLYEVPVPCADESPVDSADDHEDARNHIHDSHKEKSEGVKVQVHKS